jgi:hypothetical protein
MVYHPKCPFATSCPLGTTLANNNYLSLIATAVIEHALKIWCQYTTSTSGLYGTEDNVHHIVVDDVENRALVLRYGVHDGLHVNGM